MGQNAWDGPLRPANNCGMKDAGIAWLGICFAFPAGVALQTNPWLLACKGLVGRYDWIYLDLEIRFSASSNQQPSLSMHGFVAG